MTIVVRGISVFGANGKYPVCRTNTAEASDERLQIRRRRILVAPATDLALDLEFIVAGAVALFVLACYQNASSEGVENMFRAGHCGKFSVNDLRFLSNNYHSYLFPCPPSVFELLILPNTVNMPSSQRSHIFTRRSFTGSQCSALGSI
jgi:hypothetical protein